MEHEMIDVDTFVNALSKIRQERRVSQSTNKSMLAGDNGSIPDHYKSIVRPIPWGTYDVIELDVSSALQVHNTIFKLDDADRVPYILNPALPYFTYSYADAKNPEKYTVRVDFLPPVESEHIMTANMLECKESAEWEGGIAVPKLAICLSGLKRNGKFEYSKYCACCWHLYVATHPVTNKSMIVVNLNFIAKSDVFKQFSVRDEMENYGIFWGSAYVGIQFALYNRPEVFREERRKTGSFVSTRRNKAAAKANRKIKAYRVITIKQEELEKQPLIPHEKYSTFSVPCWGVIGHWRHYKSGKKVWINAYKKGKERERENGVYSSKEYELVI